MPKEVTLDLKKKALRILVKNGVLTSDELQRCVDAISEPTKKKLKKGEVWDKGDTVFEDDNVVITYKGLKAISTLFFGKGYDIKFLVENKTNYEMSVSALEVTVNGYMVQKNEYIASTVPAGSKTIDGAAIYENRLKECDITKFEDMKTIELKIKYEVKGPKSDKLSAIISLAVVEF